MRACYSVTPMWCGTTFRLLRPGSDRESSALGHGLHCIRNEAQQAIGKLRLGSTDLPGWLQVVQQHQGQSLPVRHILPQRPRELQHLTNEVAEVNEARHRIAAGRVGVEATHQLGPTATCLFDGGEAFGLHRPGRLTERQLRMAHDDREKIVEVVCDAGSKGPDGGQLL